MQWLEASWGQRRVGKEAWHTCRGRCVGDVVIAGQVLAGPLHWSPFLAIRTRHLRRR